MYYLKNNRIDPATSQSLLQNLSKDLVLLDLSQNTIGREGCEILAKFLLDSNTNLEELNLEQNNLSNSDIGVMM